MRYAICDMKPIVLAFHGVNQRVRQIYAAPDNDDIRELMEKPLERLKCLANSALALGCTPAQRKHLSVIMRLKELGFFQEPVACSWAPMHFCRMPIQVGLAGAILVKLPTSTLRARDPTSQFLAPHLGNKPSSALPAMDEGFPPLVKYRGHADSSYQHRVPNPRGADTDEPIQMEKLYVALQPLRFMEFSLEDVQQATLFDPTGGCVIVSALALCTIHKLLIIGKCAGQFRAKVSKDLAQVASRLDYFNMADSNAIKEVRQMRFRVGRGWRKWAAEGLQEHWPRGASWLRPCC